MARFYGIVGYEVQSETEPGFWVSSYEERYYYGDVDRQITHWQASDTLNDGIKLNHQIRILADAFAYEHMNDIRYVVWENSKWKVSAIERQYPRLILNIGGVFNEPKTRTSGET